MFDLENLTQKINEDRQIKAILWLSNEQFNFLSDLFWEVEDLVKEEAYQVRKKENPKARRSSGGNPSKLDTPEKKLFFSLYYLRTYPTFDELWYVFWISRSSSCSRIHYFLPILKRLFIELWIAPKRKIENIEDLKDAFDGNILDLIIDWTERRHFRHKDYEEQKENYSWKKNATQRKT